MRDEPLLPQAINQYPLLEIFRLPKLGLGPGLHLLIRCVRVQQTPHRLLSDSRLHTVSHGFVFDLIS